MIQATSKHSLATATITPTERNKTRFINELAVDDVTCGCGYTHTHQYGNVFSMNREGRTHGPYGQRVPSYLFQNPTEQYTPPTIHQPWTCPLCAYSWMYCYGVGIATHRKLCEYRCCPIESQWAITLAASSSNVSPSSVSRTTSLFGRRKLDRAHY